MSLKTRVTCISAWVLLASSSFGDAPLLPQQPPTFTQGAASTWNLDWEGVGQRTYFIQWSLDLVHWNYFPVMEFGEGTKSFGFSSTSDNFFVRLVYMDDPSVESLAQAKNADFDGDGVSNFNEISILHTNPMARSSDNSGISDGDRDFDGDGLSNAVELALGLDPGVSNTAAGSGTAVTNYGYDDINRLTGVTSPVSTKNYQLDQEGNIKGQ